MKLTRYILFLFVAWPTLLQAQSLRGLRENSVIKEHISGKPASVKLRAQASLELTLPFLEDFSDVSVFPDPTKWADRSVFINNSFGKDPVSIGVATLDAIDEYGNLHSISNNPASSDTLTSQPFDLSAYALSGEKVTLSFFYQCGGKGESPELTDSLLLEFYSASGTKWYRAWFVTMEEPSSFEQVILEVHDSLYKDGFRFRFRNYTSVSINDVSGGKGALSNADCWNIDYILMNTQAAFMHQNINDIVLVDEPRRLLDLYELIPWLHLKEAQNITLNTINFDIRNLLVEGSVINTGYSYRMKDLNLNYTEDFEELRITMPLDTLIRLDEPFGAPFTRKDDSEEGFIEVSSFLMNMPAEQFKGNDTTRVVLNFKDAYVYDDGTPEYGFGIEGPSMTGALMAVKFRIFRYDTLQAVDLFFNKSRDNYNSTLGFQLCVWSNNRGLPGELLYMSPETFPRFTEDVPGFVRYALNDDGGIYISDTVVFVGWKQLTDEFLNIGYDVNRNNLARTFLNTSGTWINPGGSLVPGTMMLRAVFGSSDVVTGTDDEPSLTSEAIILYPNPVSGILNISVEEDRIESILVFDISGRLVIQKNGHHNRIDVSALSPGVYQVVIYTGGSIPVSRKIVVSQ
jgi:hypothetical protein